MGSSHPSCCSGRSPRTRAGCRRQAARRVARIVLDRPWFPPQTLSKRSSFLQGGGDAVGRPAVALGIRVDRIMRRKQTGGVWREGAGAIDGGPAELGRERGQTPREIIPLPTFQQVECRENDERRGRHVRDAGRDAAIGPLDECPAGFVSFIVRGDDRAAATRRVCGTRRPVAGCRPGWSVPSASAAAPHRLPRGGAIERPRSLRQNATASASG